MEDASGIVRRYHTITATSRAARTASRFGEEGAAGASGYEEPWNEYNEDDSIYGSNEDWPGGPVGDLKAGLHRQHSLPSKYNRGASYGVRSRHL